MKTTLLVASALATAVSLSASIAKADPAAVPSFDNEKCYGVVKAGQNDCQTATHSCAGTSTADAQGDAWIYVPAGYCERIVNGSLMPKA